MDTDGCGAAGLEEIAGEGMWRGAEGPSPYLCPPLMRLDNNQIIHKTKQVRADVFTHRVE